MSTSQRTGSVSVPWLLDRGRAKGEMGYLPGLDGVRALAVIGVLLYHADLTWITGGFLGVDVFFVLSGFLITSLLLEEYDRAGRIDFRRFYLGRARRLLPALFLMLLVVSAVVAVFYRDAAASLRADVVATLLYVNNWWYVLNDASYFEFIGRPPLLKHLWSLAVEEQFYLVWPLLAFLAMRRAGRRGVRILAIILALASTAWMISLSVSQGFPDYADPSRAYFGTDAHAMGLLVGAALATFWRPGRLSADIPAPARVLVTALGIGALAGVIAFFLFVGEFTPWMYQRGGFLLLALVVALLIAMATHPASPLGRWMGTQPWRYLGQRSYGLYLWHWPIFMVTRPTLDLPLDGITLLILRLGLTVGVAELSYRFVEMPIRRGAIDRWIHRWRTATGEARRRLTRQATAILTGFIALVVAIGVGLASAPSASAQEALPADVAEALGVADGGPTEVSLDDPEPSSPSTPAPLGGVESTHASDGAPTSTANGKVSAIGDSVMLGARETLKNVIPGTRVDAAVSRFPGAFIGKLKRYTRSDRLAPTVVLHAGTNGVMPEPMLREMLDILGDSPRVIVLTTNMPRSWRAPNNKVIRAVVPDYPNAVLVDWYAASKEHPDYFTSDGIHLTPKGARAYAEVIKSAVDAPVAR
jgi:peptidoglycan/LPS O-acetylase OafA/YrhL